MTDVDPADAAAAAGHLRTVLAATEDPDDELTTSAATRHRIEGAALALDAVAQAKADATERR